MSVSDTERIKERRFSSVVKLINLRKINKSLEYCAEPMTILNNGCQNICD